jgi:thiol-disulfide isomerase/thioredoxin
MLLAGLSLLALTGCHERSAPSGASVGQPFPQMVLARLADAQPVASTSWRGRNVVLNVWATWCEPCRREMPSLEKLARGEMTGQLTVIGITTDDDVNLAREFILRHGITFQNLIDPGGLATRNVLGVKTLPETILIAGDGTVVARISGPRDWSSDEIQRAFAAAGSSILKK